MWVQENAKQLSASQSNLTDEGLYNQQTTECFLKPKEMAQKQILMHWLNLLREENLMNMITYWKLVQSRMGCMLMEMESMYMKCLQKLCHICYGQCLNS